MSERYTNLGDQSSDQDAMLSKSTQLLAAYGYEAIYETYAHQPQVTCIVVDALTHTVCAVSETCYDLLQVTPPELLGEHLQDVVSEASYARVQALSQKDTQAASYPSASHLSQFELQLTIPRVETLDKDKLPLREVACTLHHVVGNHVVSQHRVSKNMHDSNTASPGGCNASSSQLPKTAETDVIVLALEPVTTAVAPIVELQSHLNYVSSATNSAQLYTRVVEVVSSLLGYDQVVLCQFTSTQGDGVVGPNQNSSMLRAGALSYEVVAECRAAAIPQSSAWLGHISTFDAGELSQRCSHIVSVSSCDDQAVRLVTKQPDISPQLEGAQVSLANLTLKAPSQRMQDAMQDASIQAALASPLIIAGRVWGLIICQHAKPRYATLEMRALISMISDIAALLIAEYRHTASYQARVSQPKLLQHLTRELLQHANPQQLLTEQTQLLLELVHADGVAFCLDDENIVAAGSTPDADVLAVMRQSLHMTLPDPTVSHTGIDAVNTQMICSHTLTSDFPEFTHDNACRGMLYVPIIYAQTSGLHTTSQTIAAQGRHHFVIWFRDGADQQATDQQVYSEQDKIVPVPSPKLTARPWREGDVSAALELRHVIAASLLRHAETRLSELRRRSEQVRESSMARSEFLSRVSHELRTPLNAILGFAQVLSMRQLSDAQARGVKRILEAGRHLLNLVDEVLDISRVDAGHLHLSLETFSLWEVVLASMDIVQPLAADKRISLECSVSEYYTPFVTADPQRLKQVIINLLANAIKYNKDDGRVTASFVAEDEDHVRLSIEDTGIGIADDKMSRLFSPFDRLDIEQSSSVAGTGLGLTLSKSLVEAMGGNIGASSILGEGTIFWVTLPLAQLETANAPLTSARASRRVPTSARRKVVVLYMEDNPSDLDFVQYQLGDYRGVQLLTSAKGEEGITKALQYQPDVIVVDQFLPDMDSSDVVKILRSHVTMKHVAVVGLRSPGENADSLLEAGATMLIDKPLELQLLLAKLDEHAHAQKSSS
jgi:signal transduction histidine kinase/GAF domain-containing protein